MLGVDVMLHHGLTSPPMMDGSWCGQLVVKYVTILAAASAAEHYIEQPSHSRMQHHEPTGCVVVGSWRCDQTG